MNSCELCDAALGDVVFSSERWRVLLVDDQNYPGFCRVVWNAHVKEMTDLPPSERAEFMDAVWKLEAAVRQVMQPHKINLASFGNMVPHLHWHVIPRYRDDAHFPNPVWAAARPDIPDTSARRALLPELRAEIVRQLQAGMIKRQA
ncbi:HIT family protein [Undibacterium sp.]|uniref:HIT family protein n=1 Tax=Undibacterium sp. TaxID=1914977 RepID=UPI002D0A94A0|nr:HIT family protein [Undibacterium sp.]HTD05903.1 HIT family protein [Undibacterium sp.]